MITPAQIAAENTTALTEEQQLALEMLVKSYNAYRDNVGKWPDLHGEIDKEQTTPSVKTKGLKAVLTQLSALPNIIVESEGTDKAPSLFSTKRNFDELAQDVLNIVYELPIIQGPHSFILVQRTIPNLLIDDSAGVIIIK